MLRNLGLKRPQSEANDPLAKHGSASAAWDARKAALRARSLADQQLRQAEADLRGAPPLMPDLAAGELWTLRPAAWSQAAPMKRLIAPTSGTKIAPGLSLFHDGKTAEVLLRQAFADPDGPAPFAFTVDVLHFDGAFFSLCQQLNEELAKSLSSRDVLVVDIDATMEAPLPLYARVNLMQGPNHREMLAEFAFHGQLSGHAHAAFELAYAQLDETPITAAWLDLILEKPTMNALHIADLRLTCGRRAEL